MTAQLGATPSQASTHPSMQQPQPQDPRPREELVHGIELEDPPAEGAHVRQAVRGDIPAIIRARRLIEEKLEAGGVKQWPVGSLTAAGLGEEIDRGCWYVMVRDFPSADDDPAATDQQRGADTIRGKVTGESAEMPAPAPLGHSEQLLATLVWLEVDDMLWPDAPHGEARYLHGFMTNPESGVRGAGKQMMWWAEERTRREGIDLLRLDCLASNESLISLYETYGFTRVGTWEREGHWYVGALFEKRV